MTETEKFRRHVRSYMLKKQISIESVAVKLGASVSSIGKFLSGETENITLERFVRGAKLTGYHFHV